MAGILKKLNFLGNGPRRFAAVDSDGLHLRVVYAERLGRIVRVLKSSAVAIPDSIDAGDPRQLGALLRQTLRAMRLRGVGLLMNVTRAKAVLKPVSLPAGASQNEVGEGSSLPSGRGRHRLHHREPLRLGLRGARRRRVSWHRCAGRSGQAARCRSLQANSPGRRRQAAAAGASAVRKCPLR